MVNHHINYSINHSPGKLFKDLPCTPAIKKIRLADFYLDKLSNQWMHAILKSVPSVTHILECPWRPFLDYSPDISIQEHFGLGLDVSNLKYLHLRPDFDLMAKRFRNELLPMYQNLHKISMGLRELHLSAGYIHSSTAAMCNRTAAIHGVGSIDLQNLHHVFWPAQESRQGENPDGVASRAEPAETNPREEPFWPELEKIVFENVFSSSPELIIAASRAMLRMPKLRTFSIVIRWNYSSTRPFHYDRETTALGPSASDDVYGPMAKWTSLQPLDDGNQCPWPWQPPVEALENWVKLRQMLRGCAAEAKKQKQNSGFFGGFFKKKTELD